MCRWMGSHFHDWFDYNGVAFLIEGQESSSYLWIFMVNVPECLYSR